jgi:hypothetical protein
MTYSVNGKQYVALPTGWGGWIKGFAPELYGAPGGHALVVFTLPYGRWRTRTLYIPLVSTTHTSLSDSCSSTNSRSWPRAQ